MNQTSRDVYINVLTELLREESPTLYLEDFLYYFNKAISEYIKRRYELVETTQQLSDDLRAWKKKHEDTKLVIPIYEIGSNDGLEYRHLLNCMVEIHITYPDIECEQLPDTSKVYKATRLTSSTKAGIVDNIFLNARYYRPYFDIIDDNINILLGDTSSNESVTKVIIEYIKQPELVILTEEEVASDVDESQILEFSKDVGEEITKILISLILERGQNPRTGTNAQVNQSINDISIRGEQKK